jgi:hypothetical protein
MSRSHRRWRLRLALGAIFVLTTRGLAAESLQSRINQASPNSQVVVPAGIWKDPIVIDRPITLRGENADTCILEVRADQPTIRITTREKVVIESLVIRWERASSERPTEPLAALVMRDNRVELQQCRFEAAAGNTRCPSAITAVGLSDLTARRCRFTGFEFTIQVSEGTRATFTDCVVANPGHCGITAGPDSDVTVQRCLVTGSAFHAIRCTGGRLTAQDNLVISNLNRGFYLGNKSAAGEIRNNVIWGNGTGISAFGASRVEITHNLVAGNDFAGIDMRNTCRLDVRDNLIVDNGRAFALFEESPGPNRNQIGTNGIAGNRSEPQNLQLGPQVVPVQPEFRNAALGDFTRVDSSNAVSGPGLTDPQPFSGLWTLSQNLRTGAAPPNR